MKVYFNNISSEILAKINSAQKNIKIAVAWFTNAMLFDAILNKCQQIPVEVILIHDAINFKRGGLNFDTFINNGGTLFSKVPQESKMHHKFCLIDDEILINGSYNWTYLAEKNNENIIIINNNEELILSFSNEFEILKKTSIHQSIGKISYVENPQFYQESFKEILSKEYLESINDLEKLGKFQEAANVLNVLSSLDPHKMRTYLINNTSKINFINFYYNQLISIPYIPTQTYTYKESEKEFHDLCSDCYRMRYTNTAQAIIIGLYCVNKFPKKISNYFLLADAMMILGDISNAITKYKNGLNNLGSGVHLYYNTLHHGEYYSSHTDNTYYTFIKANIYLKINKIDISIKILKKGLSIFQKQENILKTQKYLALLEKGDTSIDIY